ncbi:EGF domain-specific O-linked N-acetylglucosamine transferase-like isoform X2 [Herrania umbratica]|uniref:EGF domain-specific O-linked N-acetylglucosamine transferase-like isoform X2 n=1 Tax=Herrania umbratica TaxID=108875 RepID=A0A6J1AZ25_9ROSI|nr:EGF domain-specific O-linked N-acetylglucosamine transferase-like isoform X2 [Herrania umbratica]
MACSISILFKSYFCQLSLLSLQSSIDAGNQISMFKESTSENIKPMCSAWEPISNFCEINGDIRVQGNSSTISIVSLQMGTPTGQISWVVKPYVQKENAAAMDLVKNWSVTSVSDPSEFLDCDLIHSVPAILFSLGGFSGNHFHDFSDLVIPLYITSKQFDGEVQFLVTDNRLWWITKFKGILRKLSRYDIINLDSDENGHCYPSIMVGLKYHKELGIDQPKSQDQLSMKDFRQFLRSTYSLKRRNAIRIGDDVGKRPRLLIITRRRSRTFTNMGKITRMAASLGYTVVTAEPNISTSLCSVAQIVNSCDVLMGIHGAGLTNMLFLPDNAILIQILPLGSIDGLARGYFGEPAVDMNLRYLEYKIKTKESSLSSKYHLDHVIIKDPLSVHKQGWDAVRSTYLDKQNVKLDVRRFRTKLSKALELLHQLSRYT